MEESASYKHIVSYWQSCLQLPAYNSFNLKSTCTWQVVAGVCGHKDTLCQISIICFCNWLFTPWFQQALTLQNPCSKEWSFTIFLMPLFYNPCLRESKRQEDRVKQGVHWWCPQKIRMLCNRPPSKKQDDSYIRSIITVLALASGTWRIRALLKFALFLSGEGLRKSDKLFSNIWDIHWMTFNTDSSQEPKVATAKSLSWPQEDHGQLSGAFHTTQASIGRVQLGAKSP